MKGQLRFKVLDDLKLVLISYCGILKIEDLMFQINIRNVDSAYNPTYNTIYDFRDCDFDFKLSDFEICVEEAQKNPFYGIEKRVAILVNKPKETLLTHSYINSIKEYTSNNFEVFFGISIALQYVEVSLKQKRHIEHELKKLREAELAL
jgi:hypothetical protein